MLDSALDIMCVKMGPTEEQVATITEPASDHESSAALAPYALVPTEAKGPLNPEGIFDSVLSKYGNENEKTASALNDLKPTALPTPENCGPLKPSLSDVDLKILEEAQRIAHLQRRKVAAAKAEHGQEEGKGQGRTKTKRRARIPTQAKNTKPAAKATSSGAKAKDAKHAKSAGVKRQPSASRSARSGSRPGQMRHFTHPCVCACDSRTTSAYVQPTNYKPCYATVPCEPS